MTAYDLRSGFGFGEVSVRFEVVLTSLHSFAFTVSWTSGIGGTVRASSHDVVCGFAAVDDRLLRRPGTV